MAQADAAPAPWLATLRALLLDRLGHEVPEARARGNLLAHATERARALGLEGPDRWVGTLAEEGDEWRRLVRAATVGETHFFRHPEQLRAIASAAAALSRARGRPLAVWSAGCATGEEAWTLAMRLADAGVPARVLGTDVNEDALETARAAGPYSDRSAGHVPAALRDRRFVREAAGWRLADTTSLDVSFATHNLARDGAPRAPTPDGLFDLVVCRNVLLYFPDAVVRAVLSRLLASVARDGGVWLGPADIVPSDVARGHRRVVDGERFLAASPDEATAPRPPAESRRAERDTPRAPVAEPSLDTLLDRGLVATAEDALERRVARAPRDSEGWIALAAIALSRHELARALEHLDRARAGGPRPGAAYLRGVALLRAGRSDDAHAEFLEALAFDPDDWAASLLVALHHRRLGRPLQEEVALERAMALLESPTARPPEHGPGARLVDSVHRDPAAARAEARRALDVIARSRGLPAAGSPS